MKKFLLSTVALATLTGAAMAADLPSRRAPAPYVAVPVFTWTGFYAGVNAGYGFSDSNNRNGGIFVPTGSIAGFPAVSGTFFTNGQRDQDGFTGGGQVGYNYQIGNFVIGLEADAQYLDFNNRRNATGTFVQTTPANAAFAAVYAPGTALNSGLDFFGTVRGRVGYAFDRVLVYGTGGFAYGSGDTQGQTFGRRNDDFRTGFAAGGGVEYAFTPNLIGRVEGMYVSLDQQNRATYLGIVNGVNVFVPNSRRFDNDFGVVRAGLSYKFNGF